MPVDVGNIVVGLSGTQEGEEDGSGDFEHGGLQRRIEDMRQTWSEASREQFLHMPTLIFIDILDVCFRLKAFRVFRLLGLWGERGCW